MGQEPRLALGTRLCTQNKEEDTQTKAGVRTSAKHFTWQGPRLLQEEACSSQRLVPAELLMPGTTELYRDPH